MSLCIHHPAFFPRISWPKRFQTVWPHLVIPALASTLDRSLKSDRSLFQVRALCYSLERASDLVQNKEVVLSPLAKVSTKTPHLPLSPLGSSRLWSYVMSSLTRRPTLYIRLKAHDVRVFADPKVFQSGVSSDPFLSACHWSHIIPSHSAFWRVWFGLTQSFINWARCWAAQQNHKWPLDWGDLYACT